MDHERRTFLMGGLGALLSGAAAPSSAARPKLRSRRLSRPSLGMNLISWDHNTNTDPRAWEHAVREVSGLGMDRVVIVGYRVVDRATGEISLGGHELTAGPSPRAMAVAIRTARRMGMGVSLKPLLEIDNPSGEGAIWRGLLDFPEPLLSVFLRGYRRYVLEMARLANDEGVDRFYIGSELAGLTANSATRQHWEDLIADCRHVYRGADNRLTYAANFDEYEGVFFWGALDEIGIDAYFPLSGQAEPAPSIEQLVASWSTILPSLKAFSAAHDRRMLLSEWGAVPYQGTANAPFDWEPSNAADMSAALDAYRATLLALDAPGHEFLEGIDFWHWSMSRKDESNYAIDAQSQIAQLLRSFSATRRK